MTQKQRRVYRSKFNFKSLSCAPINELGVVYLFGVLQDAFDFKIESIQAGFPDCIARRKIKGNRWEELRIEFEFKSNAFKQHKHDPEKVDMIICWEHNWKKCPEYIEVIELSSMIKDIENIDEEVKEPSKLTAYQQFCREKRLGGLSFTQIAKLWKTEKRKHTPKKEKKASIKLTGYHKFADEYSLKAKTFSEIGKLWRAKKKEEKY